MVRVLNENADFLAEYVGDAINSSKFPTSFKLANASPVFKNRTRILKYNYRPANIFSIISKIFEKIFSKQLSNHSENTLSCFQCGLQKCFSAQHCLLLMLEKWRVQLKMRLSELF